MTTQQMSRNGWRNEAPFQYKHSIFSRYKDSHYKDKTVFIKRHIYIETTPDFTKRVRFVCANGFVNVRVLDGPIEILIPYGQFNSTFRSSYEKIKFLA